jgi:hypothetical protein
LHLGIHHCPVVFEVVVADHLGVPLIRFEQHTVHIDQGVAADALFDWSTRGSADKVELSGVPAAAAAAAAAVELKLMLVRAAATITCTIDEHVRGVPATIHLSSS